MSFEDYERESEWEVCELWHDGKHEIKLSILKNSDNRQTFCMKCGTSVKFVRKNPYIKT